MGWFVRFTKTEWLAEESEYTTLRISLEIVPQDKYRSPTAPLYMKYGVLDANISSSLRRKWNLDGRALEVQLLEYARQKLAEKLQDDRFSEQMAFLLTTNDAPETPALRGSMAEYELPWGFEV